MADPIDIRSFEGIATVLGSRSFVPVNYEERHRAVGDHLGFDVSEIIAAIHHIPLCLRDEAHLRSRKRIATLISQSNADATAFIAGEVPEMLVKLLSVGTHDVMGEFVNPCVNRLISTNIGTTLSLDHTTLISRLFSQTTGISKRRRMNAELAELRLHIQHELPFLTETEVGDRIALCILGTDALRGTLGRSMQAVFAGAPYTAEYPKTGVPYIDRQAAHPCPVDGVTYDADTTLRARLDALESASDPQDRNRFFGYGAHVCLGKKIALHLWAQIQDSILDRQAAVAVTRFTLRRDDVFCVPEEFEIEVTHG